MAAKTLVVAVRLTEAESKMLDRLRRDARKVDARASRGSVVRALILKAAKKET